VPPRGSIGAPRTRASKQLPISTASNGPRLRQQRGQRGRAGRRYSGEGSRLQSQPDWMPTDASKIPDAISEALQHGSRSVSTASRRIRPSSCSRSHGLRRRSPKAVLSTALPVNLVRMVSGRTPSSRSIIMWRGGTRRFRRSWTVDVDFLRRGAAPMMRRMTPLSRGWFWATQRAGKGRQVAGILLEQWDERSRRASGISKADKSRGCAAHTGRSHQRHPLGSSWTITAKVTENIMTPTGRGV